MTHIEAAHPENNVLGNVGGMVGDAFQMTRGENELHARTHESRILRHVLQKILEDLIAVLIDDIIAFETDYPHSDSLWPDAPEFLLKQCQNAGCSDELIHKISWANAARFCSYDPFAVIPREKATVGALRAQSPDVEIDIVPRAEWTARFQANPPYQVATA